MATATKTKVKSEKATTLQRFAALYKRRKELEAELERNVTEANKLSVVVLEDWAEQGINLAKVNGVTVYTSFDFYCSKKPETDTATVCKAMKASGLKRLVNPSYAPGSLKAWVKERTEAGSDLPECLGAVLNYGEVPRLKARKS